MSKPKYRPGHFCQAEGCDNPLLWVQTYPNQLKKGQGRFCSHGCAGSIRASHTPKHRPGFFCQADECDKPLLWVLTHPSRVKRGYGRFCSRTCAQTPKQVERNVIRRGHFCQAEGCNKPLTMVQTSPSRIAKGQGRFCSSECAMYRKSQYRPGFFCQAEGCNRGILRKRTYASMIKKGRGRFCTPQCHGLWISENRTGENSPGWQGGKSFEPYPPTFNKPFKHKIRARDGQACAICGKPGRCVHHINYVKNDTTPENCITLCVSCHSKTNANRDYWQDTLTQIMKQEKEYCQALE